MEEVAFVLVVAIVKVQWEKEDVEALEAVVVKVEVAGVHLTQMKERAVVDVEEQEEEEEEEAVLVVDVEVYLQEKEEVVLVVDVEVNLEEEEEEVVLVVAGTKIQNC